MDWLEILSRGLMCRERLPFGHVVSAQGRRLGLVRPVGILGPFQLHLKPLHADLEAVHRLDRRLSRRRIIERYETCNNSLLNTLAVDLNLLYFVAKFV